MGNSESKGNIPSSVKNSTNFNFLSKLFQDYSAANKDGVKVITISNFNKLFPSTNTLVSNLLYKYFLALTENREPHSSNTEIHKHSFINRFDALIKLDVGTYQMFEFYTKMFSTKYHQDCISKADLKQILFTVYEVYTSHNPKNTITDKEESTSQSNNDILDALATSLFPNEKDAASNEIIMQQMDQLCPKLFNNAHWWILRSLSKHQSPYPINLNHEKSTKIQLLKDSSSSDPLLSETALWFLSLSLKQDFFKNQITKDDLFLVPWKILYNSNDHGLSHNRFKHHCFSYRGPSVMVILLADQIKLVLAMDTEWKDSTKTSGGSGTQLYQLQPDFKLLAENNIVLFNEKSRGLPIGLTLGNDPGKPVVALVDGLSLAKINILGVTCQEKCVEKIEVWGCAGVKAESDQKQQQKWQDKQAEQLQKVKLPGHWEDNPDKSLLEMAGITTEHAQR